MQKEVRFEVQELVGKQWKASTFPITEVQARRIFERDRKDNPDVKFRLVRIETIRTVVE